MSALTRSMALELAESGIRVNSICPGAVETPMLNKGLSRNASYNESRENLLSSTPLKRIGDPLDVAKLAYFLSDSDNILSILSSIS